MICMVHGVHKVQNQLFDDKLVKSLRYLERSGQKGTEETKSKLLLNREAGDR